MEMEYEIDNRDINTTWLWIKKGPFDEAVYIEVNPKELVKNARENNPEEEYWDHNDRYYAKAIVDTTKKLGDDWIGFAGQALVAGIALDISIEDIMSYVIENYHGMDYETEVAHDYDGVYEDMKLYKKAL